MTKEFKLLKVYYAFFILGLSLFMLGSVIWNVKKENDFALEYAIIEANATYNKDLLYRRWASLHGGVYVPISETTPPNPALTFVDERDIISTSGKKYTLVNPAYMTRQVHEMGEIQYGVKGHITSLNPIRALNKPDEWEAKALELFEKGQTKFHSVEMINGQPYLRQIQAMVTEKTCLKCHSHQGYKEGDIRGGISVSVPMENYYRVASQKIKLLSFTHLSLYFFVLFLSTLAFRKYSVELRERHRIAQKVEESKTLLQKQNHEYMALNEEYKSQNEELKIARDKAEEGNILKTAFLHNLSHEIRTPLNAICGFSNMLNNNELSAKKKTEFAHIIQNSSNQLLSIVNDILTVSALETNQEKVISEVINLDELFNSIYDLFSARCHAKGIKLEIIAGNNIAISPIYSDKTKLFQMVSNLMNNAVKFTYNGKISVAYNLTNCTMGGNMCWLHVVVQDTGIGIAPEHHEIIFERFRQADTSISQQYGGTGLGLSITKGFIDLLGGHIQVDSQLNKGSKFLFDIPVELSPKNKINTFNSIPFKELSLFKNKCILVAEDEPYNYQLIEEMLSSYSLMLVHARNGKDAVNQCLNNNCFDAVLMDIKMPVMDGVEAARLIKQFRPALPIIAQSAYSSEAEMKEYAGVFDDFLSKPIVESTLIEKVLFYISDRA